MRYSVVSTTLPGRARARAMAKRIVGRRLAACVQAFRIHSIYRWKGHVESADEFLLLIKTRQSLVKKLTAYIRASHPYELPEITETSIRGGLAKYLQWIGQETTSNKGGRA